MKGIKYYYNNWMVILNNADLDEIYFQAKIGNVDNGYRKIGRIYTIPKNYEGVEFYFDYIMIYYPNGVKYQFKLEGENCIVGDIWKEGELLDEFAMYDLYDDWDEPEPTYYNNNHL